MIIQTRAAQISVFQLKSKGVDQVKPAATVGAQAYDITRIWRDLGFVQCNIEHLEQSVMTSVITEIGYYR